MKIKALILFVLALPCLAFSQFEIKGQVINFKNRQAISGAHIYSQSDNTGVVSDQNGFFKINCSTNTCQLKCLYPGFRPQLKGTNYPNKILFELVPEKPSAPVVDTVITFDPETYEEQIAIVRNDVTMEYGSISTPSNKSYLHDINTDLRYDQIPNQGNTDDFSGIVENREHLVLDEPLSTFSIDVDCASYSILRNAINQNWNVPENSIRIEELINYFDYDYPQPKKKDPFSINTEIGDCPWDPSKKLLHIGLQGKDIDYHKFDTLLFFVYFF